ncbi:MAG TPA: PilZ domain-containing protein [Kofleriaceae bacterium]
MAKNWDRAPALGTLLSYIVASSLTPLALYPTHPEVYVQDRRLGFRIPFETMVTSYVQDRPVRCLATNLSDSGMNLSAISMLAPPPGQVMGLELDLPEMAESIWASAQVCYRKNDRMASGLGVKFVGMARSHARMLRDLCIETRRRSLGSLLARIRA